MSEPSIFEKRMSILKVISSYLIVIISIIGVIFVLIELNQITEQNKSLQIQNEIFQEQNETFERTLRQSYRPIGIARSSWKEEEENLLLIGYADVESKDKEMDKLSFTLPLTFKNKGNGLLRYLGSISYASQTEIDFRNEFLNGQISDIQFDGMYSYIRGKSLLVGETTYREHEFKNLEFSNKYFAYILFLYEDQDGNLYDTEQLTVVHFLDPIPTMKGLEARVDKDKSSQDKVTYSLYSLYEREKLCNIFKKLGHNLADLICKNY